MGALNWMQNSVFRLGLLTILGVCLHQSGQARVSEGGQRCSFRIRRACFVYFKVRLLMQPLFCDYFIHTTQQSLLNKQNMPLF